MRRSRGVSLAILIWKYEGRTEQLLGLFRQHLARQSTSSSVEALLCWITWSSCWIAVVTCSTPGACSLQDELISCTRPDVFWMPGTISPSSLPARSVNLHAGLLLRHRADLLGRLARPRSASLLDLGRHHREALAMLAGARRLDRRIQRQHVGLPRDLLDDADLFRNALHRLDGIGHRAAAHLAVLRRLVGDRRGLLRIVGVLLHRRHRSFPPSNWRFPGRLHVCSVAPCASDCAEVLSPRCCSRGDLSAALLHLDHETG